MKKLKNSLPLLITLSLIVTALNLSPVAASPTLVIVLFPTGDIQYTALPGETFYVQIFIYDYVEDLFGFEFKLKYDPTILNATGISLGGALQQGVEDDYREHKKEINNDLGYAWYAVTQGPGEAGVTGAYLTLAVIDFTVESTGVSILSLSDISKHAMYYQRDVMLTNSVGQLIGVEVYDGYFFNNAESPVHDVAITSIAPNATAVIREDAVDVNVVAKNVGNFYESFYVTVYAGGIAIDTLPVTDLAPGFRQELTFTWDTTGVELGIYIITAEATQVSGETDIADNLFTLAWDFSAQIYNDVTVTVLVRVGAELYEWKSKVNNCAGIGKGKSSTVGKVNILEAYVWNIGILRVNATVVFEIEYPSGAKETAKTAVVNLLPGLPGYPPLPGQDVIVGTTWTATETGTHYIQARMYYGLTPTPDIDGFEAAPGRVHTLRVKPA